MSIDGRKVVAEHGVAGLLKALPMVHRGSVLEAESRRWGKDMARAWSEMTYPGAMLGVMSSYGLRMEDCIAAAQAVLHRAVVATGANDQMRETRDALRLLDVSVLHLGQEGLAKDMAQAVESAKIIVEELIRTGADDPMDWRPHILAGVVSLLMAVQMHACDCGKSHAMQAAFAIAGAIACATTATARHGRCVGRVPQAMPEDAVARWAARHACNAIRDAVPAELLLAPRLGQSPARGQA